MRFLPVALISLGAVLGCLPGALAADLVAHVQVEGILLDTQLYRLPDVTVTVRSMASGREWQVQSDRLGRFDLGQLSLGEYSFRGNSADGTELFDVTYAVGQRIVLTSAGDRREQIVIVVGMGVRSVHAAAGAKSKKNSGPGRNMLTGRSPRSRGNINWILGSRQMDDNWQPMETQTSVGIRVDHMLQALPLRLVWGLHASTDDGSDMAEPFHLAGDVEASVTEFSVGVMKLWDRRVHFRPYVSTGLSLVHAELEADGFDENDDSLGVFVEVGISWRFGPGFNIGIDTRHLLLTDLQMGDADVDVNYFQVGLLAGWGW